MLLVDEEFKNPLFDCFRKEENIRTQLNLDFLELGQIEDLTKHVFDKLFELAFVLFKKQRIIDEICESKGWKSFVVEGDYFVDFEEKD